MCFFPHKLEGKGVNPVPAEALSVKKALSLEGFIGDLLLNLLKLDSLHGVYQYNKRRYIFQRTSPQ